MYINSIAVCTAPERGRHTSANQKQPNHLLIGLMGESAIPWLHRWLSSRRIVMLNQRWAFRIEEWGSLKRRVDCRWQTLFSFLSKDEGQTAQIVFCAPRNVQTFKLHCSYVHSIICTRVRHKEQFEPSTLLWVASRLQPRYSALWFSLPHWYNSTCLGLRFDCNPPANKFEWGNPHILLDSLLQRNTW